MPAAFDPVTITTERLRLRPLEVRDAAALMAIYAKPTVMRFGSTPPWRTMDEAHAYVATKRQAMADGSFLTLGLERRDDGRLIGDCSLFEIFPQCRRAEIGYGMDDGAWGHGFMHEALSAFLGHGFEVLNLNRVEADVDPRNVASVRLLERLGFRQEGLLRERWIVAGEVSDSALYGLLRRDWRPSPVGPRACRAASATPSHPVRTPS